MSANSAQIYPRPAWLIIVLSIAPAIGLGICRFAYALVLPDMRDSLDWSYASAGFMNTINAAGYLAGALTANIVIRRIGLFNTLIMSAAACVLSLVMSALTGDFIVFSAARLLSGIAAAFAFIAGGALAAHVAEAQATRKAFYLSLFYIGPAAGILISGFVAPVLLKEFGPGSWWIVWAALAGISGAMALLLPVARVPEPQLLAGAGSNDRIRRSGVMLYLIGYAFFGAGYIPYMTFMIAYVRNAGRGEMAQSALWIWVLTIRRQIRRAIRRHRSRARAISSIGQWQLQEPGFSRETAHSVRMAPWLLFLRCGTRCLGDSLTVGFFF
jgi:predicted MFS family arabinose efflux permease